MTKLPDGLYDLLVTQAIQRELAQLGQDRRSDTEPLEPADSHLLLARHMAAVIRTALRAIPEEDRVQRQAQISNEILRALAASLPQSLASDDYVAEPPQLLAAVYPIDALKSRRPAAPEIPLGQSDLLVNARDEPRIGAVLEKEIESADRIDLIIAFIRWSGLRLVAPRLRAFVERGGRLRVITTTYTGSTERRAIEHLLELGAEVKVSYQTDMTRLHAKAWMFHRETGFSTVFIGSSNLSTSAMLDGVEWNVRLSRVDAPTIVDKFSATFDSYWEHPDFETYVRGRDEQRFDTAVASAGRDEPLTFAGIEVEPWPYQRDMLEHLTVERYRHNRWRNLVVAATGTGKTVVAALDYRRLNDVQEPLPWAAKRPLSLLFVAHRQEILKQSLATFRTVMRDGSFGELYVDGHRPDEWRHVFASIQSLSAMDVTTVDPHAFDVVVIDEFHHAAAPTYRKLLDHLQPKLLLGLTATPERTDGESILHWFDGRIAVELRLWDALDRGLLSPFHYFGIHDGIDLSQVAWKRGRYDEAALENVYTGNDARVVQILTQLQQKVGDVRRMRALGFCVGVHHAEFMAARFRAAGIASEAVLGTTDSVARDQALRKLRDGAIQCLFAVDIFNEGVDVPQVDTVLFLRPTESALIFLQQLGRGLRRARDKQCLTVLDFIGNAHRNFRFDLRYRALTGASRREVEEQVTSGFPYLPAGCSIQLDRESAKVVLENLRHSIGANFRSFVGELKSMTPPVTLARFLHDAAVEPEELYRSRGWSWTRLKREAGHAPAVILSRPSASLRTGSEGEGPRASGDERDERDEQHLLNAFTRILHIDDEDRLALLARLASDEPFPLVTLSLRDRRILEGFMLTVWGDQERDLASAVARFRQQPAVRDELRELVPVLDDRAAHYTYPIFDELPAPQRTYFTDVSLQIHARYTRDEILAAIDRATLAKPFSSREGVLWHPPTNTDYFFVTLQKSEKHYSPSTRYRDYAISPELFHWESQSMTPEKSPTGQRYIHHAARGSSVMLFVRTSNKDAYGRTSPFTFLGPATYQSHTGDRPMAIVWRLHRAMPLDVFGVARVAAG
jgi:superfamily II DNA or RNA helicase/HKD family nuclease